MCIVNCKKFAVRRLFLLVCVTLTSSLVWLVNRSTETRADRNAVVDKIEGARQILPNEILSTRTLMIEKQLGRPLIVDPNMPYIGYLEPGEWRKYDLPEGIGVGRGSRGKQRKKVVLKQELKQELKPGSSLLKPRGKSEEKPSVKKTAVENFYPNQLWFRAALKKGAKAHVVAAENHEPIIMSQKDEDEYQMQGFDSEDQDGANSEGNGNGLDYRWRN